MHGIRAHHNYVEGHPERLAWLHERGWVANEIDARWEDVQRYLQAFYDKHQHLRVPTAYVTPDGVALGSRVNQIRSHNYYVKGHPERLAWLHERGWIADVPDAKWEDVQRYLQAFYDKHQHLRVPRPYVTPDGFPLGQTVHDIRSQHYIKGHTERLAWLKERGWVGNELDAKWEDVQRYLQAFYDDRKHLRVPQSYVTPDGVPLGRTVSHIRSRHGYVEDHPDRLAWLKERGWVENELDAKWEDVQRYLQAFYDDRKHLRVPTAYVTPDGVALGKTVSKIRSRHDYVEGHPERLAWLKERGFKMHARNAAEDAKRWAALELLTSAVRVAA